MKSRVVRTPFLVAGAVVVLLVGVSGCGGSKQYTIPAQVCGGTVSPKLLAPLLPEGKELKAEQKTLDSRRRQCVVSVDGKSALFIDEYRDQNYFDVLEHARKTHPEGNPEISGRVDNAVISDGEFTAVTSCGGGGGENHHVLDMVLAGSRETIKEKRGELERFAASYLPASLKKVECRR
ncbi:hypothetical protein [Streptomyces nodosus]|uniref:hypothetical protein n=1 Tax=Streptomyces nodosus TaxID=40318 RepID=UPI0011869801|nr:hypothetical protein [Streptomyces nodosus]MBB4789941.1 hypothetical protein [Streptomyces nodosus]